MTPPVLSTAHFENSPGVKIDICLRWFLKGFTGLGLSYCSPPISSLGLCGIITVSPFSVNPSGLCSSYGLKRYKRPVNPFRNHRKEGKKRDTTMKSKARPALTPEARENQMISYAVDLAEKQLREGTASSAVLCHYLKLADSKARLEREKLESENMLLKAKTEAIKAQAHNDEMFAQAITAMKEYSGFGRDDTI